MLRIWQIVDRTRVNFNWLDDFCKYKFGSVFFLFSSSKKKSRTITIMVFKVLETNNLSMTTSREEKKKKSSKILVANVEHGDGVHK